ncbi:MAG: HNH endonuclease [Oscillospiraceae bacterium]|nr:HNH endonuclease [Oscillospiraceae bacterium]
MMKDPSYCYKFYWLEALVQLILEGKAEATFDEIIDEMIANAWYSVNEFHIHLSGMVLGEPRDGLERSITRLRDISDLPANASKAEIKAALWEHNDGVKTEKTQLTKMVPYRALAGFFPPDKVEPKNWNSEKWMAFYIGAFHQNIVKLPYTLGLESGLNRKVHFDPEWSHFVQDNSVAILGWIQYEKVKWLQNNNPEVPGLVYKLTPLNEKARKLDHVRGLWNGIFEVSPVLDVFTGKLLEKGKYDVDHFIPWSFVMNDELWNLMPMNSSLNSSKSDKLPEWDPFFQRFADNQYLMYNLVYKLEGIHILFEKCTRDNLHSIWANQELYLPGNSREVFTEILNKNMRPVYDSARRQGYSIWLANVS